jgi:hypothetical protein
MSEKKTITSIFIVPTLKIDRDSLKVNGFINAYSKDVKKDVQYENAVYLLFRPENMDKFRVFLDEEYERTKSIIDDYDYDGGFVVLVYELNKKFKRDFDLVRQSRYSKTSKEFQALFPKVVKIKKNGLHRDEISLQYRVFNKTEDLRVYWEGRIGIDFDDNMEVWQGFIEENEILNIDNLKQIYV